MTHKSKNTANKRSLNILLADNKPEVCSALKLLLEQEFDLSVTSEVRNFEELLASVNCNCSDLVLLDWELPGSKGSELISLLRGKCPHIAIIAMSSQPEVRAEALNAGATAFISKGSSAHAVISEIKSLNQRLLKQNPSKS